VILKSQKFLAFFLADMRARKKITELAQQLPGRADENCPFPYAPKDFILPENSVKSFKGPYLLKQLENFVNFKSDVIYNCLYRYIYLGTRYWDPIIDVDGHPGLGQGIFAYNLKNREFGPIFKNEAMYMPLNQPLRPKEGSVSANIKKTKNFTIFNIKNNYVLREPMTFKAIKEAIPYFSILNYVKEGQELKMNVRKFHDEKPDQIKLSFGSVSNANARYKKFAIASQCLELQIDNSTKVMKINLLQNIPNYDQEMYNGIRDINAVQKDLLCAYRADGQRFKISAKDLIEITFQMAIHIGNIFAIGLEDQMHFEFKNSDFSKESKGISRNIAPTQYISIAVLTLATKGYTKYEQ